MYSGKPVLTYCLERTNQNVQKYQNVNAQVLV